MIVHRPLGQIGQKLVSLASESAFDLKTVHLLSEGLKIVQQELSFSKMCACVQNSYTLVSVGLFNRLNIKLQINSQISETFKSSGIF